MSAESNCLNNINFRRTLNSADPYDDCLSKCYILVLYSARLKMLLAINFVTVFAFCRSCYCVIPGFFPGKGESFDCLALNVLQKYLSFILVQLAKRKEEDCFSHRDRARFFEVSVFALERTLGLWNLYFQCILTQS